MDFKLYIKLVVLLLIKWFVFSFSVSILVILFINKVLLLKRVKMVFFFVFVYVFFGGNVDEFYDGVMVKDEYLDNIVY